MHVAELFRFHRWLPAVLGNEQADLAAKAGSKKHTIRHADIKCTRAAQRTAIRETRDRVWTREWEARTDCRQSKAFMNAPNCQIWKDLRNLKSTQVSRVARFLTGHVFMNRHNTLLDFGYEALDDPCARCRLCENGEESPIHLATVCPDPDITRARLDNMLAWQLDTPPPWSVKLLKFIIEPAITALEDTELLFEEVR